MPLRHLSTKVAASIGGGGSVPEGWVSADTPGGLDSWYLQMDWKTQQCPRTKASGVVETNTEWEDGQQKNLRCNFLRNKRLLCRRLLSRSLRKAIAMKSSPFFVSRTKNKDGRTRLWTAGTRMNGYQWSYARLWSTCYFMVLI